MQSIHLTTAKKILEGGQPCELKVWRQGSGEIIVYKNAICFSTNNRQGSHKIKLLHNGQIRQFNDVCLFELNDMEVYL